MLRTRTSLLLTLLLAAAFAGCVGGDDADDGPAPGPRIDYYTSDFFPADLDHDHTDPAEHTMSTNVEFVDFHDCTEDGVHDPATTPAVTDLIEWEDYILVNQANGFCIVDVSDPYNVSFVSHFEAPFGYDIDVSDDGDWAFHATQRNPPPGTPAVMEGVGTEDLPRGLYVVDISDKANPTHESFYPVPSNGVHTVHYHKHENGDDLVLIQTYDWLPPSEFGVGLPVPSVNAPATQRVEITRLVDGPDGHVLERVAVYTLPKPSAEPVGEYFPHDCTAQFHEFRERTYMYCAYWNHGMVIVDITNPASPGLVSQYNEAAPSKYNQYHYVLASDELIEDRHITVAAPELQEGVDEVGYVRVFDTTDPSQPQQIGVWTLPGVPGFGGGFLYSPHQFDLRDGKIYIGHNHGGVWVIDISNETLLEHPQSAAYFFPHGDEALSVGALAPMGQVWTALEHRGFIYSTDRALGLHVHRYVHDTPTAGNETLEP